MNVTAGQLMLTEYQAIKDEQKARIGFRDNLLYVTLAAVAAVVATTAQTGRTQMLTALPPVCVVLGWTYLANDQKISAIGQYVRQELGPRLAQTAAAPADLPIFGWEQAHRSDRRRRSRKIIQCSVDLIAFCVVPLSGLTVYWSGARSAGPLIAVSVVEALVVLGLGAQLLLYVLRPDASAPGRAADARGEAAPDATPPGHVAGPRGNAVGAGQTGAVQLGP